jgi:iron complex transport system substrate-binding protein
MAWSRPLRRHSARLRRAAPAVSQRRLATRDGFLIIAALVAAFFFGGCRQGGREAPTARPKGASQAIQVEDSRGKVVTLERPARRIVCLIESALSGLYMLGAEDALVGVSRNVYDGPTAHYYAALDPRLRAGRLPAAGNWDFVSVESTLALRPDLVVIWAQQTESIAALEELGVPVFGVFMRSVDDVYREMRALGALTGKERRAEELVAWTRRDLGDVSARLRDVAPEERPRAYFMWAQSAFETSGGVGLVEDLLVRAGARNVAHDVDREHLSVDMERLITWDPELIVMWWSERQDAKDVLRDPRWRRVSAVKTGRVHELPEVFLCDLWTLKLPFAVRQVAAWAHPGRFPPDELGRHRDEMLRVLYGGKLPRGFDP